ncbi:hypothetical protein RA210_U40041 [Rubrivivax sp. A210]|nr:hypothetical protein RA210_U40041 [Rubrivivax sp. A210]
MHPPVPRPFHGNDADAFADPLRGAGLMEPLIASERLPAGSTRFRLAEHLWPVVGSESVRRDCQAAGRHTLHFMPLDPRSH